MKKCLFILVMALCLPLNVLFSQTNSYSTELTTTELSSDYLASQDLCFTDVNLASTQLWAQAPNMQIQSMDFSKTMQKGEAAFKFGLTFAAMGVGMVASGGTLFACDQRGVNYDKGGLVLMSVGAGLIIFGTPFMISGAVRMRKANLSYNVTPTGAEFALKF